MAGSQGPACSKTRVVVVGAGFGGLEVVRHLKSAPVEVTLIDRNNYHLFQPLLYQVAAAYLDPEQIAKPARAIFRKQKNFSFRMAEVESIDFEQKQVRTDSGPVSYDVLVLSVGARTNFFGMDSLQRHGFSLKELSDSINIRNHILTHFEEATLQPAEARDRGRLTVVVGGGGSAGVEMAGALAELTRLVMARDYPQFDDKDFKVVLCEAVDRILPEFSPRLSRAARKTLEKKGVEVRTETFIEDFDGRRVALKGGETIPAATLIWTAGIQAAGLAEQVPGEKGRNGRLNVDPTLQLPGRPEVYAIGDAAYFVQDGTAVPMVAPAAVQMAKVTAANIKATLAGKPLRNFRYKSPGTLATIGRNAGVAEFMGLRFKGFVAWVLWMGVHLIRLVGFRNRLVVLINWVWDYFFSERGSRLIIKP